MGKIYQLDHRQGFGGAGWWRLLYSLWLASRLGAS